MIVRPVRSADLPALIDLARSTGAGLTTLPANEERLAHRGGWAEKAFRGEAERADADYLFVLEDDAGKVVGISAVAGAVGLREPWYNYRVGLTVSASQELNIHRQVPTLFMANDLTGNSELCSLFLHADHRSGLNGRLLSKARFLFIAEFRELFGDKVIAAMKRQARPGEFRSNLHRGGSASLIKITPEERMTAVRAAKVMGLNVAGVDILRSNHGPVVMEVNSSPGLQGIESTTGKDVAGLIISYIEKNARPNQTRTRGKG